ncbi:uncharacterized protein LOC143922117 [Arctopsyche grandis]|uniref:uncharacterized protein LOC143922117 n=1 Tax=Arctopsyche grandis TaxID=121162 RepID=UPI00406D8B51
MDPNFYNFEMDTGPSPDTSETIQISSLALLKMMKHGRAGIPLEVMGLMIGEFVDDYNIRVVDVFAMPQSATGVNVEAVDAVFQAKMMDILKVTGRHEIVVGWYHSHPGFGCWLSSTDVSTQGEFEKLCKRAVAVVIDPVQSVKGKVVIDAFRNINNLGLGEPRITTSNIGFYKQPSFISLIHGLNKNYYAFNITFKKNDLEQRMLLNMNRKTWASNLNLPNFRSKENSELISKYLKMITEESNIKHADLEMRKVGKADFRKHLIENTNKVVEDEIISNLLHCIHQYIFQ